jgi:hypothetical protein
MYAMNRFQNSNLIKIRHDEKKSIISNRFSRRSRGWGNFSENEQIPRKMKKNIREMKTISREMKTVS